MAITWGAASASGHTGQHKVGVEFSQSPATIDASTVSVTVTADIYVWTKYSTTDSSNSFAASGDFSSTADVNIHTTVNSSWSSSNIQLIRTITRTFAPSTSSTTTSSISVSLSGIETSGTAHAATVATSHVTAQKPADPPAAPTSATVTRVSDTQQTVSWTNNATSAAPYASLVLERADNVTGAATYYALASLAGTVATYSDTTTCADRTYTYRVKAVNGVGSSAYATTAHVHTMPAAPTAALASADTTNVVVTWGNAATVDENVEVEKSVGGGAYAALAASPLAADAVTVTDVGPARTSTLAYRVRTVVDRGLGGALLSAWAVSNTLAAYAVPNAPVSLTPSGTPQDASGTITLAWAHNPTDGSQQTAYEAQYRVVGAGSWTSVAKTTSALSEHALSAGTLTNGNTYEWQVKTYGQHVTGSAWSSSATFVASAKPVAAITSPATDGASYVTATLAVTWTYSDAEAKAQTAYRATLYGDASGVHGPILEAVEIASAVVTHTFTYSMTNTTTYHVGVSVRDGDNLWGDEVLRRFVVAFVAPMTPTFTATYDDSNGSVAVAITNPTPTGSEPAASHNRLYNTIDGARELIADNVAVNGSATDYLPLIGGLNTYEVECVSVTPTVATSAACAMTITSAYVFFNVGAAHDSVVAVRYAASLDARTGRQVVLHQFEGRDYPVAYQGDAITEAVSVTALVTRAYVATMRDVLTGAQPLWYRDPLGRRFAASVSGVRATQSAKSLASVSCDVTRVEP
jgi:hypothetical protein